MFTFMFGVLGSLMFWAAYLPVSFVISIFLLRNMGGLGKLAYDTLISNKESSSITKGISLFIVIFFMLFWPVIIAAYLLFKIFFNQVVWNVITSLMSKANDAVPDVKITFPKDEKADEKTA